MEEPTKRERNIMFDSLSDKDKLSCIRSAATILLEELELEKDKKTELLLKERRERRNYIPRKTFAEKYNRMKKQQESIIEW